MNRRTLLLSAAALCATRLAAQPAERPGPGSFVRRDGARFAIGDRTYRYGGTNMWYAAYLGADARFGDRARLRRELDALSELGVDNIRILGSSELSPLKNSITPAFRTADAAYNETLLRGLDFALAEMGKRGMRAVIYLTNFWEWSGGMMTYLYWVNGGKYVNMNDPAHPWPEFPDFNASFYSSGRAIGLYHDYVRAVVGRRNTVTGTRYIDDPAIMSWQLANEPRPGGSDAVGRRTLPAFYAWISSTARLIRSLDPNHLISTGSEGLKGCIESRDCVVIEHHFPEVDYLTAHIWPLNWGWVDSKNLAGTYESGEAKVREYLAQHLAIAQELNKPLVIEEFGFPRDGGSYDPASSTLYKDKIYKLIYDAAAENAAAGGPLAGTNFWAWGGEARAGAADHRFRRGDKNYLGDPPHEPQGWYSVFDSDRSTKALIRAHAATMKGIG